MPPRPVLLFDGVCTLCDGAVRFVTRNDPAERFQFVPLQSGAARSLLAGTPVDPGALESLVLVDEGGTVHVGAEAALGVGDRLRAPWPALARAARAVPRPLREAAYRLVARHRYRVFGTREACRIPTAAERDRFLDTA